MALMYEKIKNFLVNNEFRLALCFGLVLVAALSFEAGLISGKNRQNSPIIIEKSAPVQDLSPEEAQGSPVGAQNSVQKSKISPTSSTTLIQNLPAGRQDCTYVGSKNSNKYHLPTCRFAKLIKPENTVCFASVEDAAAKNYLPDKGCIK